MKRKRCTHLYILVLNLLALSITINARTFRRKSSLSGKHYRGVHHFLHHRLHNNHRIRRNEKLTVCDTCRLNSYDTPYYCPIKPDLPQCIFPTCPKICDEVGGDPNLLLQNLPPPPPARPPFPHPVNLPRIPDNLAEQFILYTKTKSDNDEEVKLTQGQGPTENINPYNPATCELPSSCLRRIRPGSKYIEFRPTNPNHQISDIHRIAAEFGLALAEFRHPMEWYSVEKSSILESVSTYKLTPEQPKLFYVVGLADDVEEELGKFFYKSDNSNPTFAVFDPRIYGRTDERCGVLSHVMGSDKRQYLTIRFWNCNKYMADGKRVANGLFMFPPGSLCYQRSEEECAKLQQDKNGGDNVYHNTIQIGQTLKRFIYLYTDQRSWDDALALCKAKGLRMLDFDTKWGDALRTADVIEHFLREAKLNPVTTFWTSGRFGKSFMDGEFTWATTSTVFENSYKDEAPPFAYSWWDDQKVTPDEIALSRRSKMVQPCVSVALNPETGAERPKLNFKAWHCNFPMYVLCYKELNQTDNLGNPIPSPQTATRSPPHPESCEKSPDAMHKSKSGTGGPSGPGEPPGGKEQIDPFNEETCTSNSLTVKRLTPKSKFVDYQPKDSSHSVDMIKDQCKKYGLLPAEIRTREDWDTIEKSGIGGVVGEEDSSTIDYFYVIGMDDSKEAGSIRYDSGDSLTFALFSPEGRKDIGDQCAILDSVVVPGTSTRGLMMRHVNCNEGHRSDQKIAYGLCMFPPTWKCYTDSTEETAAAADLGKFTTIIPLGATNNRSIFFNPVQRTREDALKFAEAAKLILLDFDPKWGDTVQVMNIFKEKLVKDGGFFQLTPFWTSGKLEGLYQDKMGKWETTGTPLIFVDGPNSQWLHLKHPKMSNIREGTIEDACLETTFINEKSLARFRPDYCDIPKYFFMYRISKKREDPFGINHLGIIVVETGPRQADPKQSRQHRRPMAALAKATTSKTVENEDVSSPQKKREISFDSVENYEKDALKELLNSVKVSKERLSASSSSSSSSEEIHSPSPNNMGKVDATVPLADADLRLSSQKRNQIEENVIAINNDVAHNDDYRTDKDKQMSSTPSTSPVIQVTADKMTEYSDSESSSSESEDETNNLIESFDNEES